MEFNDFMVFVAYMIFRTVAENLEVEEMASWLSFQSFRKFGYSGAHFLLLSHVLPELSFHIVTDGWSSGASKKLSCFCLGHTSEHSLPNAQCGALPCFIESSINSSLDSRQPVGAEDQDIFYALFFISSE